MAVPHPFLRLGGVRVGDEGFIGGGFGGEAQRWQRETGGFGGGIL
eukprot:CAMPEP_0171295388 /NCGR_PEP_ID=MMETSP0816-20121228/3955_1 /TAXON_ID=420281 /ORGANISM="Proboscia inermis, Strain CCAP1064/1" /LENGTH=44 /DNA_ID= /DNA_START= /DNA_END= /DNA_ORIENTATION=